MSEPGELLSVWHWNGTRAEQIPARYLGKTTSTGEHAVEIAAGPQLLGRGVFDTEVQAQWWGKGVLEAGVMMYQNRLQEIDNDE